MTPIIKPNACRSKQYIAGAIIGLMAALHLVLLNRTFGISSSFRHVCAAVVPNRLDFLRYD